MWISDCTSMCMHTRQRTDVDTQMYNAHINIYCCTQSHTRIQICTNHACACVIRHLSARIHIYAHDTTNVHAHTLVCMYTHSCAKCQERGILFWPEMLVSKPTVLMEHSVLLFLLFSSSLPPVFQCILRLGNPCHYYYHLNAQTD